MSIIGFKTVLDSEISSTNEVDGDLFLNDDGTHAVLTDNGDAAKVRAAVQGIRHRLGLLKGEYFLNLREGVPYFQSILVKNPNLNLIRSLVLQVIFSYPGIVEVTNFSLSLNRTTRALTINFVALLDGGIQFNSEDFGSIVLDLNLSERVTT